MQCHVFSGFHGFLIMEIYNTFYIDESGHMSVSRLAFLDDGSTYETTRDYEMRYEIIIYLEDKIK